MVQEMIGIEFQASLEKDKLRFNCLRGESIPLRKLTLKLNTLVLIAIELWPLLELKTPAL